MKVLLYNELDPGSIPGFAKLKGFLESGDFRSAEIKKVGEGLYRARLDRSNRLLLTRRRYNGETYALILEYIPNHAYDRSRFLANGATVDESRIPEVWNPDEQEPAALAYVNPGHARFHMLDKIISFDDRQEAVFHVPPPLIVIGSAGSGKTALTLEKMKEAVGDVLYVTRSPYLVHNARTLYYAAGYENEDQAVDFLSFQEFLESIAVPDGREISLREFSAWHGRQRLPRALKDAHQLFEEFKGVLTGPATGRPWLSREEYLGLGIKQTIFLPEDRAAVYDLFARFLEHMDASGYYDANIVSHAYLERSEPRYDFVVVDEVQDLTNVQLRLILESLREPRAFLLCGDANQIVHPNFFSWAGLKSFFYRQEAAGAPADLIRILDTNYRNTPEITELANRILKLKHARFGSVDRESNYLVRSNSERHGSVLLLRDDEALKRDLDRKTRESTRFAVIVMHPEQKAAAKAYFTTPLVFAIQEAKGLEYENIILFNFTSADQKRFRAIAEGVSTDDIARDGFAPARNPGKGRKMLDQKHFMPYAARHPTAVLRQVDRHGVDFRDVFNQTPLMNAARQGNGALVERLIGEGANPEVVNNVGFNAFRVALEQACRDPQYARQRLTGVYSLLEPASVSLQVDGRLVKLDNRLMEFLLLNLMMAMFYTHLGRKVATTGGAFQSNDFVAALAHVPDALVPPRRKKREYISGVLAKNEIDREDPYNRKLFMRIRRGHYIINPRLRIRIGEDWWGIHELLDLGLVGHYDARAGKPPESLDAFMTRRLQDFRSRVREMSDLPRGGAAAQ